MSRWFFLRHSSVPYHVNISPRFFPLCGIFLSPGLRMDGEYCTSSASVLRAPTWEAKSAASPPTHQGPWDCRPKNQRSCENRPRYNKSRYWCAMALRLFCVSWRSIGWFIWKPGTFAACKERFFVSDLSFFIFFLSLQNKSIWIYFNVFFCNGPNLNSPLDTPGAMSVLVPIQLVASFAFLPKFPLPVSFSTRVFASLLMKVRCYGSHQMIGILKCRGLKKVLDLSHSRFGWYALLLMYRFPSSLRRQESIFFCPRGCAPQVLLPLPSNLFLTQKCWPWW